MSKRLEKALAAVRFDTEADAVRPGWGELDDVSSQVWQAIIRGNIGQVWQLEGGYAWCWMTLDGAEPSKIIVKGISSRRGWAMDACEIEAPQSH